jgi:2',3'-cyclic-nucleotide 2'-phosphodiesterase (5'-nucleotidase family)
MDLDWCAETVERLRAEGNLDERTVVALSHIGHLVERTHDELQEEASALGMTVAYDGMVINI